MTVAQLVHNDWSAGRGRLRASCVAGVRRSAVEFLPFAQTVRRRGEERSARIPWARVLLTSVLYFIVFLLIDFFFPF